MTEEEARRAVPKKIFDNKWVIAGISLALIALAIAFIALSQASSANQKIATEANNRSVALQAVVDKQRATFCGTFESIAYPPPGVVMPSTGYGQNLQAQTVYAVGPEGLGCTPNPTDRR